MKAFEIKTTKSNYPYLVIAESFKEAIDTIHTNKLYENDITSIQQMTDFYDDHIRLSDKLTNVEKLRSDVLSDLRKIMPQWKHMENGACGGGADNVYLIRSSAGHYYTSNCVGPGDTYLVLSDLEKLSGLEK